MKKIFIHIALLACGFALTTCTPEFTMEDIVFKVAVQSNDENKGTVTEGGKFHYKDEITLEAKPIENYEFITWSDGVTDNPRKLVVTSDTILIASFQILPQYTIIVHSNDSVMGTVSGGGTYYQGRKITLRAIPQIGDFIKWSDGSTNNPRTITVTQDATYTAYFTRTEEVGHIYVDLGLPSGTLWAAYNVGAESPEDYGDYFAWGETTTKQTYNWDLYEYGSESLQLTKYCNNSDYGKDGFTDNKFMLEAADDAAVIHWGGRWRTPNPVELQELLDECTWTWTTINDIKGYKLQGKNGKSIFLPAAGWYDNSDCKSVGYYGNYLSSAIDESTPYKMWYLVFYNHYYNGIDQTMYTASRTLGRTVRPVIGKTAYSIIVSANDEKMGSVSGSGTYYEHTQATLRALPAEGYQFVEWNDGNTENPRTITVTQNEIYTAHFAKLQQNNGYKYVDLGLPSGTLWAECNVGAESPEDYGDYFAWGETQAKTEYNWSTYKHCNGNSTTLTKYCADSKYGTVDNKLAIEFTDDAANANWGGTWRLPTRTELRELYTYCTWKWVTINGVNGYEVHSTAAGNTNHIFLPAAGCRSSDRILNVGVQGRYWSLEMYGNSSIDAFQLYFNSESHYTSTESRTLGCSIRPVYSPL